MICILTLGYFKSQNGKKKKGILTAYLIKKKPKNNLLKKLNQKKLKMKL